MLMSEDIMICTLMTLNIILNSIMKSCSCWFIQHTRFILFVQVLSSTMSNPKFVCMLCQLQGGLE